MGSILGLLGIGGGGGSSSSSLSASTPVSVSGNKTGVNNFNIGGGIFLGIGAFAAVILFILFIKNK